VTGTSHIVTLLSFRCFYVRVNMQYSKPRASHRGLFLIFLNLSTQMSYGKTVMDVT
jgi:hypothetical protein